MEIDHTVVSDFLYKVGMFGVTDFERNFDPTAWIKWTESHYEIPIIAIVVYLVFCFGVQRILEGKEKFDLKMPLAYWNMALSVFSFTGMFRTVSFPPRTGSEMKVQTLMGTDSILLFSYSLLYIYYRCRS